MAPRRGAREPGRRVRAAVMRRQFFRTPGALRAAAVMVVLAAVPAGAAPNVTVGGVKVSDTTPLRGSAIEVSSAGWQPGSLVTIAIAGRDLLRAPVDADGKTETRVVVPDDAPIGRLDLLTVTGTAATGVPQQIVTGITVVLDHPPPAPHRPWGLVFALAAVAAVLLLASRRVDRRVHVHAAATSGPPSPASNSPTARA